MPHQQPSRTGKCTTRPRQRSPHRRPGTAGRCTDRPQRRHHRRHNSRTNRLPHRRPHSRPNRRPHRRHHNGRSHRRYRHRRRRHVQRRRSCRRISRRHSVFLNTMAASTCGRLSFSPFFFSREHHSLVMESFSSQHHHRRWGCKGRRWPTSSAACRGSHTREILVLQVDLLATSALGSYRWGQAQLCGPQLEVLGADEARGQHLGSLTHPRRRSYQKHRSSSPRQSVGRTPPLRAGGGAKGKGRLQSANVMSVSSTVASSRSMWAAWASSGVLKDQRSTPSVGRFRERRTGAFGECSHGWMKPQTGR